MTGSRVGGADDGGTGGSAARGASRRDRLIAELEAEHTGLTDASTAPRGFDPAATQAAVVDEVLHARYVEVHERRRPPYGSIIVRDLAGLADRTSARSLATGAVTDLRPYADGVRIYVARTPANDADAALVEIAAADELGLVRLARDLDGVVIRRFEPSTIAIYSRTRIVTNTGFEWHIRPVARALVEPIAEVFDLPESLLEGIANLLDFAVHSLGPNNIGATFIVALDGELDDNYAGTSNDGRTPPISLNVFEPADQPAVASLLSNEDGAAIVDDRGVLKRYQSILSASESAQQNIRQHGGTRHTSAKRFSYDHADSLAIVVSEDGPVTVFGGGFRFALPDPSTPWQLSYPPRAQTTLREDVVDSACGQCGKGLRLTALIDTATGPSQVDIECPICAARNEVPLPGASRELSVRPARRIVTARHDPARSVSSADPTSS